MSDFPSGSQNGLRISCIVCTYNRVALLGSMLEGLLGQTLPRAEFEIILVDDGSTENVAPLIERYRSVLPINYIRQENRGLGAAKNTGVAMSQAPIVLFMDDDDVPAPSLLAEHLRIHELQPEDHVAVLGHTNLHPEIATKPLMQFVTNVGCYLFSYGRIMDGAILDYSWFWGGRSSCKRGFLSAVQPFNPQFKFGCEDIELGYRLSKRGLRVVYNQSAVTTMLRAFTVDEFCRRTEMQGRSNWLFSQLHPSPEIRTWSQVNDAEHRWNALRPRYRTILDAARHLDKLAQARTDHGIEIDSALTELLHSAYWNAFDAARLKGTASAAQKSPAIREIASASIS